MLMTEEQALSKWCPHARQSTDEFPTYNRNEKGGTITSCSCVASDCMAWRWSDPAEKNEHRHCEACDGTGYSMTDSGPGVCPSCDERGVTLHPYPTPARRGFCGAFGRPEAA